MTTEKVAVIAKPGEIIRPATVATPPGVPDVQIVPMSWLRAVLVRTLRTYLQSLVGFLIAGATGLTEAVADAVGAPMPVRDFGTLFLQAASLSVAPAVIALLQNAIELLASLDSPSTRA